MSATSSIAISLSVTFAFVPSISSLSSLSFATPVLVIFATGSFDVVDSGAALRFPSSSPCGSYASATVIVVALCCVAMIRASSRIRAAN